MMLYCGILCNRADEAENNDYLRELGVKDENIPKTEDYWLMRYIDLSKAVMLFAFTPRDEEGEEGTGNLAVDIDNSGMAIVTDIPFHIFEPFVHRKNADVVMSYNASTKELLFMG